MKKVFFLLLIIIPLFFVSCTNEPNPPVPPTKTDPVFPDPPSPIEPNPVLPITPPIIEDPIIEDPETKLTIENDSFDNAFVWANPTLIWDYPGSYIFGDYWISHEIYDITDWGLWWFTSDTLDVKPASYYIYILWTDDPALYRTWSSVTVKKGEHEVYTFTDLTMLSEVFW